MTIRPDLGLTGTSTERPHRAARAGAAAAATGPTAYPCWTRAPSPPGAPRRRHRRPRPAPGRQPLVLVALHDPRRLLQQVEAVTGRVRCGVPRARPRSRAAGLHAPLLSRPEAPREPVVDRSGQAQGADQLTRAITADVERRRHGRRARRGRRGAGEHPCRVAAAGSGRRRVTGRRAAPATRRAAGALEVPRVVRAVQQVAAARPARRHAAGRRPAPGCPSTWPSCGRPRGPHRRGACARAKGRTPVTASAIATWYAWCGNSRSGTADGRRRWRPARPGPSRRTRRATRAVPSPTGSARPARRPTTAARPPHRTGPPGRVVGPVAVRRGAASASSRPRPEPAATSGLGTTPSRRARGPHRPPAAPVPAGRPRRRGNGPRLVCRRRHAQRPHRAVEHRLPG